MAGRGPQTFKKRQKEQERKERRDEKQAKRLERKRTAGQPEETSQAVLTVDTDTAEQA